VDRRGPHGRTVAGGRPGVGGGPEAGEERDAKLGERSDLGAGGGVVSGGGEHSASEREGERASERARARQPRKRERRPPIRGEAAPGKQAGPGGCRPSTPTVTPRPPARPQDDEETAAPHAPAGPDGQPGTVSVTPSSPSLAPRDLRGREEWGDRCQRRGTRGQPLSGQPESCSVFLPLKATPSPRQSLAFRGRGAPSPGERGSTRENSL
jgi:hypothetical protein